MEYCFLGCGKIATNRLKNGKWCCSKSHNSCEENMIQYISYARNKYGKNFIKIYDR